jgi:hypothetical protein
MSMSEFHLRRIGIALAGLLSGGFTALLLA